MKNGGNTINNYQPLYQQAQKLFRHNRQGSYKTRERYFEAYQRFLKFVAEKYRLQKLSNISGKHLSAYVAYMQEKGLAASTIKTDLAAIRFWHDQIPGARYSLPGNEEYDLERRSFGKVDRTWSQSEFDKLIQICRKSNHFDYLGCLKMARYAGLRIHECMRIDTATARNALKSGLLTIKGKGGKVRQVPLCRTARQTLKNALHHTPAGQKLFVPEGKQIHIAITELQNFIGSHREEIRDPDSDRPLTFHGLRHTCAAEWYKSFLEHGYTEYQARLRVSQWLGHERDDVTRIYLASVLKDKERGVED